MAKKIKKASPKKIVRKEKKNAGGLLRILEAVVIIGAFAAFLMKFLKGEKNK